MVDDLFQGVVGPGLGYVCFGALRDPNHTHIRQEAPHDRPVLALLFHHNVRGVEFVDHHNAVQVRDVVGNLLWFLAVFFSNSKLGAF